MGKRIAKTPDIKLVKITSDNAIYRVDNMIIPIPLTDEAKQVLRYNARHQPPANDT